MASLCGHNIYFRVMVVWYQPLHMAYWYFLTIKLYVSGFTGLGTPGFYCYFICNTNFVYYWTVWLGCYILVVIVLCKAVTH